MRILKASDLFQSQVKKKNFCQIYQVSLEGISLITQNLKFIRPEHSSFTNEPPWWELPIFLQAALIVLG